MCGVEYSKLRNIRMITIFVYLIYIVLIIIYNVICLTFLTTTGSGASFNVVSSKEYVLLFLNLFVSLVGFFGIYYTNKRLTMCYIIANFIVVIISVWITVILFVLGSQGRDSKTIEYYFDCYVYQSDSSNKT